MVTVIGILASGAGSNLGALIESEMRKNISVIICNNPGAKALDRGREAQIPTVLIDHRNFDSRLLFDQALVACLQEHQVQWLVLAGFMRIVGPAVIEAFPQRVLNIHPALLPSFPGLHGQRQAIDARVRIAGCTVHLVDSGVDSGPILAQAALGVRPHEDEKSLSRRILQLEHVLYPLVVQAVLDDKLQWSEIDGWHLSDSLALPPHAPKDALFSP
jgi:phosphoribosylglycinamide formyltransferase 1